MLSIVIPTFNEEEYLPRLLASIRSQSYADYEIVVADNFSPDRTRAIAGSFGARVVAGGDHPGKGRNRGAEAARGETILFLDADVVLPCCDWLERKMEQFEQRHLGIGTCLVKPLGGRPVDDIFHALFNAHMFATQFVREYAPGFCIFVRKALFDQVGGFDESVKIAEDHDFVRRAAEHGKFRVMTGPGIAVSVRRFDRDGRAKILGKYLMVEAYNIFKGSVRTEAFNYTWGHPKKSGKRR